jgi:hypothetical protein
LPEHAQGVGSGESHYRQQAAKTQHESETGAQQELTGGLCAAARAT